MQKTLMYYQKVTEIKSFNSECATKNVFCPFFKSPQLREMRFNLVVKICIFNGVSGPSIKYRAFQQHLRGDFRCKALWKS